MWTLDQHLTASCLCDGGEELARACLGFEHQGLSSADGRLGRGVGDEVLRVFLVVRDARVDAELQAVWMSLMIEAKMGDESLSICRARFSRFVSAAMNTRTCIHTLTSHSAKSSWTNSGVDRRRGYR